MKLTRHYANMDRALCGQKSGPLQPWQDEHHYTTRRRDVTCKRCLRCLRVKGSKARCSRCKHWKPIQEFRRQSASRTGLAAYCRKCHRETRRTRDHTVLAGYRDLFCPTCGDGPFVTLWAHYRRHPTAPRPERMMSDDFAFMRKALFADRLQDGQMKVGSDRRTLCKKGIHQLAGQNVLHGTNGRQCRACFNACARQRHKPLNHRKRKCRHCREWFKPRTHNQRSCSLQCTWAWHGSRRIR